MFRWLLPVGAALALNVSIASAGPPPVVWSGTYVGAHVGYGWGDVRAQLSSINGKYDVEGVLAGLQTGRNWQNGAWVYGWIADASFTGIDGRWVFDSPRYLNTEYDWLATLRGRAGHLFGNTLFYFTAGLAAAGIESVRSDPSARSHESRFGYAIGIGFELQGPNGWTTQIEYLRRDFGTQSLSNYRLDHKLDTVTVGMNRRY